MVPSDLTAVPPGVLNEAALDWRAAGEQAGNAAESALTVNAGRFTRDGKMLILGDADGKNMDP
jgi:hypothetical protein